MEVSLIRNASDKCRALSAALLPSEYMFLEVGYIQLNCSQIFFCLPGATF